MKMIGKCIIYGVFLTTILPTFVYAAGTCDAYQKEADAIEGLVPRIENGKLISLSMYGEATFIAPKRSLISKARTKAELKAKRAYVSWLKESLASNTLSEDLLNQIEKTDEKGNTSGVAEEINRQAEHISSSTSSVLSGIIKLDECVAPNEKFILVRMGWKPSLSKMAADSKSTILSETARGDKGMSDGNSAIVPSSHAAPVKGYRKKSKYADDF